ncbi:LytTR family DNA-binding domain-containing protein [Roseovarius sp. EL26]|uniref:LytTR family DNA-binding domain-containing protein n=1 Tax=Roseovarius sp. EL26 TaxID=2126672 RepID=UPI0013C3E5F5|nr:LytTR family DNA-binding domain-containing protein [Roseovarius sp. EL26]
MQFTLRELRGFVRSKNIIVLSFATLFLLVLGNPVLFPTLPHYTSRAFYWGLCIVLYLLIVPSWVKYTFSLWTKLTSAPLPLLCCTPLLVVALSYFADNLSIAMGDWAPDRGVEMTWVTVVKNCLIGQILDTVSLSWLLPLYRARQADEQGPNQADDLRVEETVTSAETDMIGEFVVLNGRSIPWRSVLHVKSAEHYLVVTTKTGATEYRARMKDFIRQMSAESGLQTHRSYWVSADDALELSGNVIKTRSGVDIPVSRGRAAEVRDWFRSQVKLH